MLSAERSSIKRILIYCELVYKFLLTIYYCCMRTRPQYSTFNLPVILSLPKDILQPACHPEPAEGHPEPAEGQPSTCLSS
jgi:hypothetical protein